MRLLAIRLADAAVESMKTAAESCFAEATLEIQAVLDPVTKTLRDILSTYDVVAIPLSLPHFASLHLAECAHRMNSSGRVMLVSGCDLGRPSLEPLFDYYVSALHYSDRAFSEIFEEIHAGRRRELLEGKHLRAAIEVIVRSRTFAGRGPHESATLDDYDHAIRDANLRASAQDLQVGSAQDPVDFAISYAGSDRLLVEKLATYLSDRGHRVFFDSFYRAQLAGTELTRVLDDVYFKCARLCIFMVSHNYARSEWTARERRSAMARAFTQRDGEYIVPVRLDDTMLSDLPPTIAYLPWGRSRVEEIGDILIQKLAQTPPLSSRE